MIYLKIGAAYIRVSDDRQDEYSPSSQIKKIMDFAKKKDFCIPDDLIFFDDGISAKSVKKRGEFNRMIAMSKETPPKFSTVFVWKFSRFARNQEESIVYKSLLKKRGIDIVSVSEPMLEGPFGTLIERIIEWMDEYYLINLSSEVKRGMIEKAGRGEAMTKAVFGYDLSGKTYIKNQMSETVKEIFEKYISGMSPKTIASILASRGIITSRGNPPDARWINYILNNPVYTGKIRWSYGGRTASRLDYTSEKVMIVDGIHEAIISDEIWLKAQNKINYNKNNSLKYQRETKSNDHFLSGILRCSICNSTLAYQNGKYPSYQCRSYLTKKCDISHSVSVKKVNIIFNNMLRNICSSIVNRTVKVKQNSDYIFDITISEALFSDKYGDSIKNYVLKHIIEKAIYNKKENQIEIYLKTL